MSDTTRRGGPSDARLDRAIDRAVRDMMHVDPRPGFRGRVLSRLEPEPLRGALFSRFAMAAGALALVVLAVFATLRTPQPKAPAVVAQNQSGAAAPASAAPPVPSARAQITPQDAPPPAKSRAKRTPPPTSEPIQMPQPVNVFDNRRGAVAAAASLDVDDAVWSTPSAPPHDDRTNALPPLVIPGVEPPAPIVVAPLNPRGPGRQ